MRGIWNFTGSIVSDDGAIKQLTNCTKNHTARCPDGSMTGGHNFAVTLPKAAALALKAGCDVDYGETFASPTWGVPAALQHGLVVEQDLRAAVRRSLSTRFAMGEYDEDVQNKPKINPWNALDANQTVNCKAHRQLACSAAEQSMVLVSNEKTDGRGLPLLPGLRSLVVMGAAANSTSAILSRYTGQPELRTVSTLLKGIQARAKTSSPAAVVRYAMNDTTAAMGADAVIVVVQSHPESESHDRASLLMRPEDASTLKRLEAQLGVTTKAQIIVVVVSGAPVDTSAHDAVRNGFVSSVIYSWQPGMEGGTALAKLIFGDSDFSAAMAVTAYFENYTSPNRGGPRIDNISLAKRGYRFIEDKTFVYRPFGFAGSYSEWRSPVLSLVQPRTGILSVNRTSATQNINVSVVIEVQRQRSANRIDRLMVSRPLLCFLSRKSGQQESYSRWPSRWLVAFTKVHGVGLSEVGGGNQGAAGPATGRATAHLSFGAEAFSRWNSTTQQFELVAGEYEVSTVDTSGVPVGAIGLTLKLSGH